MDWDTWGKLYKRLLAAYGKPFNGEQCYAYYESLSQFSAEIVEQAIRRVRETHKTWPTEPVLCEACRSVIASRPYKPSDCDVCYGALWADAPDEEHFGLTYTNNVVRCWQCYPNAKWAVA